MSKKPQLIYLHFSIALLDLILLSCPLPKLCPISGVKVSHQTIFDIVLLMLIRIKILLKQFMANIFTCFYASMYKNTQNSK